MVCGETPPKEREAIIERFRNGQTKVLVNSQILVVGFDYPELDTVVYAKPTRSLAQYYQVVGRLLRLSKGNNLGLLTSAVLMRGSGKLKT